MPVLEVPGGDLLSDGLSEHARRDRPVPLPLPSQLRATGQALWGLHVLPRPLSVPHRHSRRVVYLRALSVLVHHFAVPAEHSRYNEGTVSKCETRTDDPLR